MAAAAHRLILLGASNLTFSFPLIMQSLLHSHAGPWEVFAAHGHGRSFCQRSYVLNRGLPAISECGLWNELQAQPPAEHSWALLTDLGNDLIYGVPLEVLLGRVEQTLQRLQSVAGAMTFVRPPLERLVQLSERQYRIFKRLLFPGPILPWGELWPRVVQLDEYTSEMARSAGATVVTPERDWYGLDPIHIRGSRRRRAWETILESWNLPFPPRLQNASYRQAVRWWSLPPAERTFGKRMSLSPQPQVRHPQLTLWLY